MKTAWLIELKMGVSAFSAVYFYKSATSQAYGWTSLAIDALQFHSEKNAQDWVSSKFSNPEDVVVREHGFL